MKLPTFALFATGLCFVLCLNAQAVQRIQNGAQLTSGDLNVRVQFYSEGTVRVVKWPAGGTSEKASLSVIQKDVPDLKIRVEESAATIRRWATIAPRSRNSRNRNPSWGGPLRK